MESQRNRPRSSCLGCLRNRWGGEADMTNLKKFNAEELERIVTLMASVGTN